jgi:hypothetical protein
MSRRVASLLLVASLVAGGCGSLVAGGPGPVRVPAALPADVPLPAPAVLRAARDQGAGGITLVFEVDAPPAEAEAGMRGRLQAGGWTLLSEAAFNGAVFTSYRKSGRSVALGASRAGAVTVIGLSYRQSVSSGEGDQG